MWILFARAPAPDRPYWAGRRFLAALDALVWPALVILLITEVPGAPGVLKPVMVALTVLVMQCRLRVALWRNHRYRFTTWWAVRVLGALLFVGAFVKIALAV